MKKITIKITHLPSGKEFYGKPDKYSKEEEEKLIEQFTAGVNNKFTYLILEGQSVTNFLNENILKDSVFTLIYEPLG